MRSSLLFAVSIAVIMVLTTSFVASSELATAGPPISTHGYSIFDETIVDMTWPQVEKAAQEEAIVLFPTGVIEEHGPHMGLGVDAYLAYLKCKLVRRQLESKGIKIIVAPPYYWGINNNTGAFPGSFTVRRETMKAVLYDTMASFRRWGFHYLFVINHHGDHEHNFTILEAVKEARIDTGIRAYCVLDDYDAKRFGLTGREAHVIFWKNPRKTKLPSERLEIHADMTETSVMTSYFPDEVKAEIARGLRPTNLTIDNLMVWRQGWGDAKKMTPLGYFGDPGRFDPAIGKQIMEEDARSLANLIEAFLNGTYKAPIILV